MALPEKCQFYPFFRPHLRHLVLDPDNDKEEEVGVKLQPSQYKVIENSSLGSRACSFARDLCRNCARLV